MGECDPGLAGSGLGTRKRLLTPCQSPAWCGHFCPPAGGSVWRNHDAERGSVYGRQCAFARHAQPAPPAPQPPNDGWLALPRDDSPAPTIPGRDNSLSRLSPWQAGHAGFLSPVTKASNSRLQSWHWYSKIGMDQILTRGSGLGIRDCRFGLEPRTANREPRTPNREPRTANPEPRTPVSPTTGPVRPSYV